MIEVITNKNTSLKEEAYYNNKCQSNVRSSKERKYNNNKTLQKTYTLMLFTKCLSFYSEREQDLHQHSALSYTYGYTNRQFT